MNSYLIFFLGVLSGWAFLVIAFFVVRRFFFEKIAQMIQKKQMKKITEELKSGIPLADLQGHHFDSSHQPTDEQMQEAMGFFQELMDDIIPDKKKEDSEEE
jgi:type 1 glutamine amidotransferase